MAEFCYECFKETFDVHPPLQNVILSDYLDLFEGCACYKHVVIDLKKEKTPKFNQFKLIKKEKAKSEHFQPILTILKLKFCREFIN